MEHTYDKDEYIAELETINKALTDKIVYLNKRKQARNNDATNKWRGKAMYLRRKCTFLLTFIENNGLSAPPLPQRGDNDEYD